MHTEDGFVHAKILRFDPSTGEPPRLQEYQVSVIGQADVLDLLRDIYTKLDPTLAFRNYDCYRGVCSGCLMEINGRTVQACSIWVKSGDVIAVGPAKNFPVIKDLVVDFQGQERQDQEIQSCPFRASG